MRRCQLCNKERDYFWSWQPFGPDTDIQKAFTTSGNFYRGFPVIKVCDKCKNEIVDVTPTTPAIVSFTYKGIAFYYHPLLKELVEPPF